MCRTYTLPAKGRAARRVRRRLSAERRSGLRFARRPRVPDSLLASRRSVPLAVETHEPLGGSGRAGRRTIAGPPGSEACDLNCSASPTGQAVRRVWPGRPATMKRVRASEPSSRRGCPKKDRRAGRAWEGRLAHGFIRVMALGPPRASKRTGRPWRPAPRYSALRSWPRRRRPARWCARTNQRDRGGRKGRGASAASASSLWAGGSSALPLRRRRERCERIFFI